MSLGTCRRVVTGGDVATEWASSRILKWPARLRVGDEEALVARPSMTTGALTIERGAIGIVRGL